MKILEENCMGPAFRYGDAHLYLMLDCLMREDHASRMRLTEVTGLGEGSVRSLIRMLRKWGLIDTARRGTSITDAGRRVYSQLNMRLVDCCCEAYATGEYQCGVIVRDLAKDVTDGLCQRDTAVRNGADGATVFVMRDGKVVFPGDIVMDEAYPDFAEGLRAAGMAEGDVFMLVGAATEAAARCAAAATGVALL